MRCTAARPLSETILPTAGWEIVDSDNGGKSILEAYYQAVAFLGLHLGIVFVMVFLISFLECIRCTVKGEFRKRPLIVAIISLYVLVVSIQHLAAM